MFRGRALLWLLIGLVVMTGMILIIVAVSNSTGRSADEPIIWAADAEGGVPYIFLNPEKPDEYIGFEVELARALAKEMGREIRFKQYDFSSLTDGLLRGDFDMAMNGLEITPNRKDKVRFCRPYYIYKLQLVVREDEKRFSTLEELKGKENFTIGTLEATAAQDLLEEWKIPAKLYPDQEGPYKDLQNGVTDGVLFDLPIASFYANPKATNPYAKRMEGLKFLGEPLATGYYGIAVRPEDKELADEINAALERLLKKGELQRIYGNWDIWNKEQEKLAVASVEDISSADARRWTFNKYFPLLLHGAIVTVLITFASMTLAVIVGLLVALVRMYGGPFHFLAIGYIEFFRGIPVLLLLYFLYFGLPAISRLYDWSFVLNLNPWLAAIIGLGLNYAAYEAEIYRSAISAVPKGQWEAAASLGMSGPLTFRRIILPQSIRGILPPMTNDFVALFKDTSLVSVIAVVELNKQYQILTKSGGDFLVIGAWTAILYLVMSVPLGYLSRYLENRWGGQA